MVRNTPAHVEMVISLANKLEELQKPINDTPATVGEYFEKYLKKECTQSNQLNE